ncbi:unnamed protein product [Onchocerca flexuosa]|uniref:Uncharacterized protein n=1 Tax=Onchocerca flexuosa TaxID=387005 RepID=A0A183HRD2_9BILA|nr:unnamed protein product [Onchocerca flexuosa]
MMMPAMRQLFYQMFLSNIPLRMNQLCGQQSILLLIILLYNGSILSW